jgi:hypothetical protein
MACRASGKAIGNLNVGRVHMVSGLAMEARAVR